MTAPIKLIIVLFGILSVALFGQGRILFTYVDHENGEVRASICDENGENKMDIGFNKTYLPVWFNGKVLLNSLNYIWRCESNGENFTKIGEGFRASSSTTGKYFSFYTRDGIAVFDSNYNAKKNLVLDVWTDVSVTWIKNDSIISFYDPKKESTIFFNIENDSLYSFGKEIFHPVWSKVTREIIYNKVLNNGNFAIFLNKSSNPSEKDLVLTAESENALVPIWSNNFDKIAYLRIKEDSLQTIDSDMLLADLILYDLVTRKYQILVRDAGYTDQAYPQFSFDDVDENIFYTSLSDRGTGIIKKVNLESLKTEIISKNILIDERIPLYCKDR